jgi:mannosyltransferase
MSTSEYSARRFGLPRLRDVTGPIATEAWLLGALVVIATVIRIVVINDQSYWADEALTAYEARLPFGDMLNVVLHFETTPPLYFVVIWAWGHLFGTGEVALRSVSAIAGVAMVPIAYVAGRELVSRWAGVVAAALVTVNPFLIWYSQEARSYMLLAALTGLSFMWFVRARRDPSRRSVLWWAVTSALALMTHFFAGFAVLPEAAWLLWISRTRLVAAAVGAVIVVQGAMLPFALIDTSHGTWWISHEPRLSRIWQAVAEWGVSIEYRRTTISRTFLAAAVLLLAVGLLLTLAGDRRTREGARVGGSIAAFVWLAPLALGLLGQDYFLSRNVIPAVIPLAVAIGAACVVPRARIAGGALAVGLLALFSVAAVQVQTHPYLQRPNWRAVAHALDDADVPRAVLVAGGTTADPLKIYLPRVTWVQPARGLTIREVDIVGATKRLPLVRVGRSGRPAGRGHRHRRRLIGSPVPRAASVPGATLITRFRVDNWIVARFRLKHPIHLTAGQLTRLAPRYFRRTPQALLVFFQRPGR